MLTRTWAPSDSTSWAGVLLGEDLAWRTELDAEALGIAAVSTRPNAGLGYRAAVVGVDPGIVALGGVADDRGASGGGSVAILAMPE
ncbi:MAG: hypothetical protein Q8P18_12180 [Pseudomonadota bacterium]|nr:hypothetical protein [Pseudomonadota bacterium]